MHHDDSDLLGSSWLIYMLAKSSNTPEGRLLSLFDILNDWLKAPNMPKHCQLSDANHALLLSYCTAQAQALGAESPEILAEHIVLIARNAALQNIAHPLSNSLMHAKKAANALILAQTQPAATVQSKRAITKPRKKLAAYSIAATLALAIGASLIWSPYLQDLQFLQAQQSAPDLRVEASDTGNAAPEHTLTAQDATQMYAKFEQMRQGSCQFPEVLQMPDKHKAIYLENVVGGKLPANLEDLAIANEYMAKIRCNYTPMLMAASK
ncbi:hypothetical protein [Methylotenera mobilis]|uniref:Uncharacterized protein n=1 Tax=Methylotenera mobilis (strain JLW8 / ATCC BAA-1282 / DSM 17540) TaxID=583345 RepID=C6WU04_METML|nr:hypothetical protein [Methylotenera mobilis]ACT47403.1 hypothetical protein Mmol_0493 [Methylotenera mobilis JLW8]